MISLLVAFAMHFVDPVPVVELDAAMRHDQQAASMERATDVCVAALEVETFADFPAMADEAFEVCRKVALAAQHFDVPPEFAVAIAYKENRLRERSRVGGAGEVGALQILPRYYCPGGTFGGCCPYDAGPDGGLDECEDELIWYGARALRANIDRYGPDLGSVAAHWTGGVDVRSSDWSSSGRVMGNVRRIRAAIASMRRGSG